MSGHSDHRSLVVFTSLAIAGAGLVSASAYFELMHGLACARGRSPQAPSCSPPGWRCRSAIWARSEGPASRFAEPGAAH